MFFQHPINTKCDWCLLRTGEYVRTFPAFIVVFTYTILNSTHTQPVCVRASVVLRMYTITLSGALMVSFITQAQESPGAAGWSKWTLPATGLVLYAYTFININVCHVFTPRLRIDERATPGSLTHPARTCLPQQLHHLRYYTRTSDCTHVTSHWAGTY